jgi:hypothetical protein
MVVAGTGGICDNTVAVPSSGDLEVHDRALERRGRARLAASFAAWFKVDGDPQPEV